MYTEMRRLRKMEYLIKHNFKTELFHMIIKLNNPYISAKLAISSQKIHPWLKPSAEIELVFLESAFPLSPSNNQIVRSARAHPGRCDTVEEFRWIHQSQLMKCKTICSCYSFNSNRSARLSATWVERFMLFFLC